MGHSLASNLRNWEDSISIPVCFYLKFTPLTTFSIQLSSHVAQLVKNLPAVQETLVWFLGGEVPLEKGYATHSCILGLPWCLDGKESACNVGHLGLITVLERYPGRRHDNPLQYSFLENPHGQRSMVGYSPWGMGSQTVTHDWVTNTLFVIFLFCMYIYTHTHTHTHTKKILEGFPVRIS